MKKVLTIVGARPQFIKAGPVSKALGGSQQLREVMVHTGQHYDFAMSEKFFKELDLPPPKYNLGVGSGRHGVQTGEIMKRLEPVLEKECPDVAVVYGDTNSTLAGAVTASKAQIPVAHVEAGLRSFNRSMAEEINRIVVDHVSTLLFCPTTSAVKNLEKEGITDNVFNVGDVMYDAVVSVSRRAERMSSVLQGIEIGKWDYILATVHRAENTDNKERLSNIFVALSELAREIKVIVPLHPRTRKMLVQFNLEGVLDGVKLIEPLGFLDMMSLESNARMIATDSGGVQKEAYFHRVPCVTLRDETEWVETVATHWNTLADVGSVQGITDTIRSAMEFAGVREETSEYGDGKASSRIMDVLVNFLSSSRDVTVK